METVEDDLLLSGQVVGSWQKRRDGTNACFVPCEASRHWSGLCFLSYIPTAFHNGPPLGIPMFDSDWFASLGFGLFELRLKRDFGVSVSNCVRLFALMSASAVQVSVKASKSRVCSELCASMLLQHRPDSPIWSLTLKCEPRQG